MRDGNWGALRCMRCNPHIQYPKVGCLGWLGCIYEITPFWGVPYSLLLTPYSLLLTELHSSHGNVISHCWCVLRLKMFFVRLCLLETGIAVNTIMIYFFMHRLNMLFKILLWSITFFTLFTWISYFFMDLMFMGVKTAFYSEFRWTKIANMLFWHNFKSKLTYVDSYLNNLLK